MTSIQYQLNLHQNFKDQVQVLKDFYLSRKMDSPLEPDWIHSSYNLAFRYLDDDYLTDQEILSLHSIVESHSFEDGMAVSSFPGFPNAPERIMHEGWKAGTATWVFMGRDSSNAHVLKDKWIAVSRTLPKHLYDLVDHEDITDTLWIAYNLDFPFGADFNPKKCVGPAVFYEDLKKTLFNFV